LYNGTYSTVSMYNFQQRKKIRKMLTSRWAFGLLAFITVLLVRGAWGVHLKMKESEEALRKVHENLSTSIEREAQLSKSIESLKTPEGVEREIRGKFNVAKNGEEVIMIVDAKQNEQSVESETPSWADRFAVWLKSFF
jgi:gas vesicle protein